MSPQPRRERFDAGLLAAVLVPLVAYVVLGTPVLGLPVGVAVAVAVAVRYGPTARRVHAAVGAVAVTVTASTGVPAVVYGSNLGRGFDQSARLWVSLAAALLVIWAGQAVLARGGD